MKGKIELNEKNSNLKKIFLVETSTPHTRRSIKPIKFDHKPSALELSEKSCSKEDLVSSRINFKKMPPSLQYERFKAQAYEIKKLKRKLRYCQLALGNKYQYKLGIVREKQIIHKNLKIKIQQKLDIMLKSASLQSNSPFYDFLLRYKQKIDEIIAKDEENLGENSINNELKNASKVKKKQSPYRLLVLPDINGLSVSTTIKEWPSKEELHEVFFSKNRK